MKHAEGADRSRRNLILKAPVYGAALVASAGLPLLADQAKKNEGQEEDVSTNEDLMREHGVLKRVLLAYDEVIRRIRANRDLPPQTVTDSANIIRKFIEEYQSKAATSGGSGGADGGGTVTASHPSSGLIRPGGGSAHY